MIGEVFFAFPARACMIILTALAAADQRLYEAAEACAPGRWRVFWTVTLPGCRYGLISAGFVVFTLVITDFGVPKVIGGSYNVLATDVYKQVIGQFNFQMGAVVGMLLLTPAVISFVVDRMMQRRQVALLSARAVPYEPKPSADSVDASCWSYLRRHRLHPAGHPGDGRLRLGHHLLALRPVADVDELRFQQYRYQRLGRLLEQPQDVGGDGGFRNDDRLRRRLPGGEGGAASQAARSLIHLMCMIPLAVPGVVLGLSYIFFFNCLGQSAELSLSDDDDCWSSRRSRTSTRCRI